MTEADMQRGKAILGDHLPASAVEPLFAYVVAHGLRLHFSRERRSKLGDYKCPQRNHNYHEISVNGDMNPFRSLFVLLHEMAHLETYLLHHNSVQPHGHEWQRAYGRLLTEYLPHFPQSLQPLLAHYAASVPLSRNEGDEIERRLLCYDADYDPEICLTLSDLPIGSLFSVVTRPDMLLRSVEKRRTRYRCEEVATGATYLVTGRAPVRRR